MVVISHDRAKVRPERGERMRLDYWSRASPQVSGDADEMNE